jgi:uncharacterized phage protein (TIGR01671 family)
MREIKFRGQMTTGKWVFGLPHLDLPNSTAYFNECSYRICWNPESGGQSNAPIKNGTLCQFTGLQDRNGNDIYENDLVTITDPYNNNTAKGMAKVIFSTDYVGGWVASIDGETGLNIGTRTNYIEVFGNIFDNSELFELQCRTA